MRSGFSEQFLNMGDLQVVSQPCTLSCIGLGSCIGLFLYDRVRKIAGGAHIVLSQHTDLSIAVPKGYYAESAVEELLRGFAAHGSNLKSLRAKITGGASLFHPSPTATSVGYKNAEMVKKLLIQRKIYIAASHVGGNFSRSARFNAESGELEVKLLDHHQYILSFML